MPVFDITSKGIRAYADPDGDSLVVRRESEAVADADVRASLLEKRGRLPLRQSLINEGILAQVGPKLVFTQDFRFRSPSEAASIIWGANLNGQKIFQTRRVDGMPREVFGVDSRAAQEGHRRDVVTTRRGRNAEIAKRRKELDRHVCAACRMRLIIEGHYVVECHHLNPLVQGSRATTLDDLVTLCPTCHRVAHMSDPPYSVDELTEIMKRVEHVPK